MSTTMICRSLSLILVFFYFDAVAWPDVEVESREYKTMVQTDLFASSDNEDEQLSDGKRNGCLLRTPALMALEKEIGALALSVGAESKGYFHLQSGMPRSVEFYDTPRDCRLHSNDWIFRLRREYEEEAWEGTLKSRSGDRYHSTYRRKTMNQCCENCRDLGGKFEEDLNLLWHSQFSYSHKCEIHRSRQTNFKQAKLDDISFHWEEMERVFVEDMGWDLSTRIAKVSDLTIRECVYNGLEVDFDNGKTQHVGKFAVTIWYEEESTSPSLAELSFTLKSTGKKLEDWNQATIMTSHAFWNKVKHLSIVEPNKPGKTEWVYKHNSTWCEA